MEEINKLNKLHTEILKENIKSKYFTVRTYEKILNDLNVNIDDLKNILNNSVKIKERFVEYSKIFNNEKFEKNNNTIIYRKKELDKNKIFLKQNSLITNEKCNKNKNKNESDSYDLENKLNKNDMFEKNSENEKENLLDNKYNLENKNVNTNNKNKK
ncbi:hypothetical protein NAPIS_ORF01883 [Vairimorpha apis BRL 01]|uniref:Uncharacterized protein n=1 Tax=Vairimorpha apis BRL 01 TaxID=1037528 RepID=T0MHU4_9MICR|nr:hypothetical protein NAPIS_ORF01883 [Vairimorpha apis BRL 01]